MTNSSSASDSASPQAGYRALAREELALWLTALRTAAAVFWLLDGALARWGFYQSVWHSPLFRVCLFVCLFCVLGLRVYD